MVALSPQNLQGWAKFECFFLRVYYTNLFIQYQLYYTAVLHMIIFLRHAERGDNELPTKLSEIPYDPPITSEADTTIRQTSQQLSEIFRNHGITRFQLLSSKFLRCLMTASKLQFNLEKLGFKMEGTSYEVDDRVGEYLREDWYDEYPMGKLIYHSSHLAKYIGDVKFSQNYKTDKYREFPENYVKFHNRVANFKKELKFPPQNICLLIVTHGFVVRELCFTMNQLPRYQNEIKYCGYAAYKQREQGELLVKSKL